MSGQDIPSDAPAPRRCCITLWPDFKGYGFNLHSEKNRSGQYIGKVDSNSPAEAAGLKKGDRIIEVNGVNIRNENHKQVVERIKSKKNETTLLVLDSEADQYYKERSIIVGGDQENVIDLRNGERGAETITSRNAEDTNKVNESRNAETTSEVNDSRNVETNSEVNDSRIVESKVEMVDSRDPEPTPEINGDSDIIKKEPSHSGSEEEFSLPEKQQSEEEEEPPELPPKTGDENVYREDNVSDKVSERSLDTTSLKSAEANEISPPILSPSPDEKKDVSRSDSEKSGGTTPSPPPDITGLNLNMTAAQMREQLSSRKKKDPRKEKLDFRKKYEIVQTL